MMTGFLNHFGRGLESRFKLMTSQFCIVCKSDKCTVDTKIHEFTSSNLNFVRYYFPMETKCTITKQIMEILLTFDCSCTRCASGSNTTETLILANKSTHDDIVLFSH